MPRAVLVLLLLFFGFQLYSQKEEAVRRSFSLNEQWQTVASDREGTYSGFEDPGYAAAGWETVNVPHNWDRYEGYRRQQHGNRHGYAWYRKTWEMEGLSVRKKYFLFFEGVGSYATVYLNGQKVGTHAGGRTSFTLDVTDAIHLKGTNLLAVRADHPALIEDLPWVCGGCSSEYGFSEGSQPMGIFRPVHLVETNPIRMEPFGIHVWNDTTVSRQSAALHIHTEVKNYGQLRQQIEVVHEVVNHRGQVKAAVRSGTALASGQTVNVEMTTPPFEGIRLWSPEAPYLYDIVTRVYQAGALVDEQVTPYGIRHLCWQTTKAGNKRLLLNGEPLFINGTCEYEHQLGRSHAFSDEMVEARVSQIRAAGFNAFRDAHQPHHFGYHQAWDSLGMLWWPQMAAHIWFDTPEFQDNFKALLRDWVRERRNSPSIILWGLENESTLPEWFARECTEIIRALDPTSPTQRLVTTCNGGGGTDWDVPQNWTGTYGGNPDLYFEDIRRQVLVGEYGAWRTIDLHSEGPFDTEEIPSEERMTWLLEKKIRLADSVKEQTGGHFQWIFSSHENPGRNQSGEGLRELDRVGPVNYKGLLTAWGEPSDAYYMYRSNYVAAAEDPMVYIGSHTWPNRWAEAGLHHDLAVYSNCAEVELFNGARSLGKQQNPGRGRHFEWDQVSIETNLLRAVGYEDGQPVAEDMIRLSHLPQSDYTPRQTADLVIPKHDPERNYLYRVNCGGGNYQDSNGNQWMADVARTTEDAWGSTSWTDAFEGMPPYYASQRRTFDPIWNTSDEALFQTFRYGMNQLRYHFPVAAGTYEVALYFVEPWYGTGGAKDCRNWRVFDVSIDGATVIDDLDIWSAVGHDQALIRTVEVTVPRGDLVISFPEVKSGQAVISAIAISTADRLAKPAPASPNLMEHVGVQSWLDWGSEIHEEGPVEVHDLLPELFGAEWLRLSPDETTAEFELNRAADLYVGVMEGVEVPGFLAAFDDTKERISVVAVGQGERAELGAAAPVASHPPSQARLFARPTYPLHGADTVRTLPQTAGSDNSNQWTYRLYKRRLSRGEKMSWHAGDLARHLIVMAQPAARLDPPYDLKPKVPYDEDVVILEGEELQVEQKFGLGCVTFMADAELQVSWPIKTGVADYHAIHVKYSNETGAALQATVSLVAADGTLMQRGPIALVETRTGKYREETFYTKSMINAGDYQVRLSGAELKGLSVRGIRVQ